MGKDSRKDREQVLCQRENGKGRDMERYCTSINCCKRGARCIMTDIKENWEWQKMLGMLADLRIDYSFSCLPLLLIKANFYHIHITSPPSHLPPTPDIENEKHLGEKKKERINLAIYSIETIILFQVVISPFHRIWELEMLESLLPSYHHHLPFLSVPQNSCSVSPVRRNYSGLPTWSGVLPSIKKTANFLWLSLI